MMVKGRKEHRNHRKKRREGREMPSEERNCVQFAMFITAQLLSDEFWLYSNLISIDNLQKKVNK